MKKYYSIIFLTCFVVMTTGSIKLKAQTSADSLSGQVSTLKDRVSGVEERLTTAENDLAKLTKIKVSGYIQAQFQYFENPAVYPSNTFLIRRARVKFQYEPVTGVAFVLQPDIAPGLGNVVLKDAYAQLNDPWMKTFSLWMGQFNRPNYEVEYSSSSRELPERSKVITALYPGERAIGAKLEIAPPNFGLKAQIALFNGNENLVILDGNGVGLNYQANNSIRDFDNYKDLMARVIYEFKLGNLGALNIGAHGYFGKIKANSYDLVNSDYTYNKEVEVGDGLKRNWFGIEAQFYADILGGLAIKGEYITGVNAYPGYYTSSPTSVTTTSSLLNNDTLSISNITTKTSLNKPGIEKNFSGYYVYLLKNIGKKNQFALRWDYYDPNSKLNRDEVGLAKWDGSTSSTVDADPAYEGNTETLNSTKTVNTNKISSGTSDIAYGTLTIGWNYYFTDNIKLMLAYEMPMNEKVGVNADGVGNVTTKYTVNNNPGVLDYSDVFAQNVLTFRIQAKF
jgi:phosphate-selective porin